MEELPRSHHWCLLVTTPWPWGEPFAEIEFVISL
jgi:hypothetical protein